jgi:hypothetical protein
MHRAHDGSVAYLGKPEIQRLEKIRVFHGSPSILE